MKLTDDEVMKSTEDYGDQCTANENEEKQIKKMGTVEPRFNDTHVFLSDDTFICDEPLAFIYGAIKKYGTDKAYLEALKEYIIREAKSINTYTVEGI